MRLDKFLTDCGLGSRTEVKTLLKAGRISVSGKVQKDPSFSVSPESIEVFFDSKPISWKKERTYLLHKPAGVITATEDPKQTTVMDILPKFVVRKNLAPVGRLDKDTEGFLLLTTDGKLAHELISPSKKIPKTYFVLLENLFSIEDKLRWENGVSISVKGEKLTTNKAIVEILSERKVRLTIYEGKYHQIKLMAEAIGNQVIYLKRESMGGLSLGELKKGEVRELDPPDLELLKQSRDV